MRGQIARWLKLLWGAGWVSCWRLDKSISHRNISSLYLFLRFSMDLVYVGQVIQSMQPLNWDNILCICCKLHYLKHKLHHLSQPLIVFTALRYWQTLFCMDQSNKNIHSEIFNALCRVKLYVTPAMGVWGFCKENILWGSKPLMFTTFHVWFTLKSE